ncbi:uncharacterized protein LOC143018590 [Oratosquilla oratoria]|uniref:uncharacterized protein LOC143018590 n=1 Tax=Oratosquilla oratoria TaxID=337810 RepID=UPI003F76E453
MRAGSFALCGLLLLTLRNPEAETQQVTIDGNSLAATGLLVGGIVAAGAIGYHVGRKKQNQQNFYRNRYHQQVYHPHQYQQQLQLQHQQQHFSHYANPGYAYPGYAYPGYPGGGGGLLSLFRRRRDAPLVAANELDAMVEELFQEALEKDDAGCSLKLVCEIGGRAGHRFGSFTKETFKVFSDTTKRNLGAKAEAVDRYQMALNMGRDGVDCTDLFESCPFDADEMMAEVLRREAMLATE